MNNGAQKNLGAANAALFPKNALFKDSLLFSKKVLPDLPGSAVGSALFPKNVFDGVTKPIAASLALDFRKMLDVPDIGGKIVQAFHAKVPSLNMGPQVSGILLEGFSADLAKAYAPAVEAISSKLRESAVRADPSAREVERAPELVALEEAVGLPVELPGLEELVELGKVARGQESGPEFLAAAAETVQKFDGADEALEAYIGKVSGVAEATLGLIRDGVYAFIFTAWVLAILGLSLTFPELDTVIGATGLAAPAVAAKGRDVWDGFVEKT